MATFKISATAISQFYLSSERYSNLTKVLLVRSPVSGSVGLQRGGKKMNEMHPVERDVGLPDAGVKGLSALEQTVMSIGTSPKNPERKQRGLSISLMLQTSHS